MGISNGLSSGCRKCCPCCSLKCVGISVLVFAAFPTIINPFLDSLTPDIYGNFFEVDDAGPMEYIEGQTDIIDYPRMGFLKASEEGMEIFVGPHYLLVQPAPKWFTWIVNTVNKKLLGVHDEIYTKMEPSKVDIWDARKAADQISFEKSGFMLHTMERPSETAEWRDVEDIKKFQNEMEPKLRELYPAAKRIVWTHNMVRGGHKWTDQPGAVDGPHLDYSQNDTARLEFFDEWPINEQAKELPMLVGDYDSKDEKLGVILGIWKPVYMKNPVCDHPLAIMDASTFLPEHERPYRLHINFGFFRYDTLSGAIVHDPSQKWYYYPFQTSEEVLIFTQYSRGKWWANPHGSFKNPNCPDNHETRQSIEMRVGLFF